MPKKPASKGRQPSANRVADEQSDGDAGGKRPYSLQKASSPRQRTSKAKSKKGKKKKEKRTQKFKIQKRLPLV